MRAFVAHDEQGKIKEIMVSPPDAPTMNLVTKPGQFLIEIEPHVLGIDLANPTSYTDISEKINGFRVDVKAVKAKLVKS